MCVEEQFKKARALHNHSCFYKQNVITVSKLSKYMVSIKIFSNKHPYHELLDLEGSACLCPVSFSKASYPSCQCFPADNLVYPFVKDDNFPFFRGN